MMDRRSFFRRIAQSTAAAAILIGTKGVHGAAEQIAEDPERALWVPGAKTFFMPEAPALYRPRIEVAKSPPLQLGAHRFELATHDGLYRFDHDMQLISACERGGLRGLTEMSGADLERVRRELAPLVERERAVKSRSIGAVARRWI